MAADTSYPDYLLLAKAPSCSDTLSWGNDSDCQAMFPGGSQDALAYLGQTGGCQGLDQSAFQAKIDDLTNNWNPTGIYSCSDLNAIVGKVMAMTNVVHNAVMTMQATYDPSYLDAVGPLYNDIGSQATTYLAACNAHYDGSTLVPQAAAGTNVNAPGLKVWVVTAMSTMLQGMNALAIAACTKPFWLGTLNSFDNAMSDLYGVAKGVVGAAITLASTAINVVESAIGGTAWFVKWLPTGLLALLVLGGGIWFYRWNKRTHKFPKLIFGEKHSEPVGHYDYDLDEDDYEEAY